MNKKIITVIVSVLLAVIFTAGCTAPTPSSESTATPVVSSSPVDQLPDGAFELPEELIDSLIEFFDHILNEYYIATNSFESKINRLVNGEQVFSVSLDPSKYYYTCAYYNDGYMYDIDNDYPYAWFFGRDYADKCTWIGFTNQADIVKFHNGQKLVLAMQLNKALIVRNILTGSETDCTMEYFQLYTPVFVNGINIASPINYNETYVYKTDSKAKTIFFSSDDTWFYYFWGIPSVVIDGKCYVKEPVCSINKDGDRYDHDLKLEFGDYYDDLVDVMITDRYSEEREDGSITYYGLFRLDDIGEIVNKYRKS